MCVQIFRMVCVSDQMPISIALKLPKVGEAAETAEERAAGGVGPYDGEKKTAGEEPAAEDPYALKLPKVEQDEAEEWKTVMDPETESAIPSGITDMEVVLRAYEMLMSEDEKLLAIDREELLEQRSPADAEEARSKRIALLARAFKQANPVLFGKTEKKAVAPESGAAYNEENKMDPKGEVDVSSVRERIREKYDTAMAAKLYADAYAGTGMTAEEIWEEVICDSLGDMNIFSGTHSEVLAHELLDEAKTAVETVRQDPARGPPYSSGTNDGGKTSRESSYRNISKQAWRQIQRERMSRYGDHFDTMPRLAAFHAYDMLFVIQNLDESSFHVIEEIDPAKQQEKANIALEVMKDENIEYASEYRRRVENLRRWQRRNSRDSLFAENTGTGKETAGASAQHGYPRNGGTVAGEDSGDNRAKGKSSIETAAKQSEPTLAGEVVPEDLRSDAAMAMVALPVDELQPSSQFSPIISKYCGKSSCAGEEGNEL